MFFGRPDVVNICYFLGTDKNENFNSQCLFVPFTPTNRFNMNIHLCNSLTIHRCTRNNQLNSRNRYLELFTGHIIGSPCLFNVNFTSYQCQSIIYQRLGIVRPKLSNFDSCATCPPHVHPSSNTRPTLGLPQTPVKPYYSPIPSFKSRCF